MKVYLFSGTRNKYAEYLFYVGEYANREQAQDAAVDLLLYSKVREGDVVVEKYDELVPGAVTVRRESHDRDSGFPYGIITDQDLFEVFKDKDWYVVMGSGLRRPLTEDDDLGAVLDALTGGDDNGE